MITVGEYTDLFLTIIAGLGIVFEMPILVFFLALMGILSAGWMWRNFRYCHSGDLHHRRHHHSHSRHHEHVHLRRAHDRALFDQHRDRLVRAPDATKEARREEQRIAGSSRDV